MSRNAYGRLETQMTTTHPSPTNDDLAVRAVERAFEDLQREAREAQEKVSKMRTAILDENVGDLLYVSPQVQDCLGKFSGWNKEIFPGCSTSRSAMDTSVYRIGDSVAFHGGDSSEHDRGKVVAYQPGHMRIWWARAEEVHDEDPDDTRITLISRAP